MNAEPDKKITDEYLIALLVAVLQQEIPPALPPGLDMQRLYKMSVGHSLVNMASYGLSRLEPPPQSERLASFREASLKALAGEARQEWEVLQILDAFEVQHIKCMVLKGFIIKQLYPKPDMRIMADVDILLTEGQLKHARDIMLWLGYTTQQEGGNHDVYYKKPVMNVELHRALFPESMDDLYAYFGSGWERARLKAGSNCQFEMSPKDFYIYLLAHMAKHFRGGGTGIRSVIDIWEYNRHYGDRLDQNYIRAELKKAGLYEFARRMEALSAYWFNGQISAEYNPEISDYMLGSGTYGTARNAATNQFIRQRKENERFSTARAKYILHTLFPDRTHMEIVYPFLKKLPLLLPLGWIMRALRVILFRRYNIRRNLYISSIRESEVRHIQEVQKQLGFK